MAKSEIDRWPRQLRLDLIDSPQQLELGLNAKVVTGKGSVRETDQKALFSAVKKIAQRSQGSEKLYKRREAIRYAFVGGTAAILAILFNKPFVDYITDTLDEGGRGINTPYGKIYPNYRENGFLAEKIPQGLDLFFLEYTMDEQSFKLQPTELLSAISGSLPRGLLERFAKDGTLIVFADGPGLSVQVSDKFAVDKILTVAEFMQFKLGRNVKSGFLMGSGRKDIEQQLFRGRDSIRSNILSNNGSLGFFVGDFPNGTLETAIQRAGGAENLLAARILELPRDFRSSDLQDRQRSVLIKEIRPARGNNLVRDVVLLNEINAKVRKP